MAQKQHFRINDLNGGLNPDRNPVSIEDNEAVICSNLSFDRQGSLRSRLGYGRYASPEAPIVSKIDGLGRWTHEDNPDTNRLLYVSGGTLYAYSPNTGLTPTIPGVLSPGRTEFLSVAGRTYIADGVNNPRYYDRTGLHRLVIPAPTVAPTATASTAFVVPGAGTYQVAYSYLIDGEPGNSSPRTTVTLTTNQTIEVTATRSTDPRVTGIRWYHTTNGGTTLLWSKDSPNDATIVHLNQPLSPLTPPTDANEAPVVELLALNGGQLWGAKGRTLHWSKVLEPTAWPTYSNSELPFESSDYVTGMATYENNLLVFGNQHIFAVSPGETPTLSLLRHGLGAVSSRAITKVEGQIVFLSHEGLRMFPGLEPVAPKLDRTLAELPSYILREASLTYVPQETALWLSVGNLTYVIYLPTRAISTYTFSTPAFLQGGLTGDEFPIWIDSGEEFLNQYGTNIDPSGPLGLQWRSKVFRFDPVETMKFIRRLGAFATSGSQAVITVTIQDAFRSYSVPLSRVSGEEAKAIWDSGTFDAAVWTAEGIAYFIGALPAQTLIGHTIQIDVSATNVDQRTEFVPPFTFQYREANRFLGV